MHTAILAKIWWLKQHQLQQCLMQGCQAVNPRKPQVAAATVAKSYLHNVLQDNHSGVKITKKAMQVWAEALDAWLQQLSQETVQGHTSQVLTQQMSTHPYSCCWQKASSRRTQHLQNQLPSIPIQALDQCSCCWWTCICCVTHKTQAGCLGLVCYTADVC